MLFPVCKIGDVVATKCVEIDLGLGQLSEDQGNVARQEWTFASIAIRDRRAGKEFFFQPACQRFRLCPSRSLHIEFLVVLSRRDEAKLRPGH